MNENTHSFDLAKTLREYADHLNAINKPKWRAEVFYELMSGALIWSDERNKETPTEVIWALRFLFAYRTSLMLNEPREELKSKWDLGLELFPQWVGFRPERREPTPGLLEIYRRGYVGMKKCLRDMDREVDVDDV